MNKSQKSIDDVYALIFARPLSKQISKLLVKTSITPNQISVFGIILGTLSSLFIILGNNFIAAVILYLSFVADCVDGEIARLKNQFTKGGFWLESSLDLLPLLIPILIIGIVSQEFFLLSLATSFFLLTRIRVLASNMVSLKYNLKIKEVITNNKLKRILWQLRYGTSMQYMIIIIPLLFSAYSLILWLTLILAGGYYILTIIYEIKYYLIKTK